MKPGWKGVMLSNIEEPEPKPEPESEPPEHGSDDDRQLPNTSMEMASHNTTNSSVDDEFKFDINWSRYIPYSEIKHPTPPKESVKCHHMYLGPTQNYLWGCGMIPLKVPT